MGIEFPQGTRVCVVAAVWQILALATAIALGQTPQAEQNTTKLEVQKLTSQRDALFAKFQAAEQAGEVAEAVKITQSALPIQRELVRLLSTDQSPEGKQATREETEYLVGILDWLATWHLGNEQFDKARETKQSIADALRPVLGATHYRVRDAELAGRYAQVLAGLAPKQREQLAKAVSASRESNTKFFAGDVDGAIEFGKQARTNFEQVLGDESPETASSYSNLAYFYSAQRDFPRAEVHYQKALAIREKILGEENRETANSYLNLNLASVYRSQGDNAQAEQLYLKALAIHEKILGEQHPVTASNVKPFTKDRRCVMSQIE